MCIFQVAGDQRPEPLLPCSVPKLHPVAFCLVRYVFGKKIDAYCGLSQKDVHWQFTKTDHGCIFK